ncbi:MAG: hydroxyacylglutathione hydrolase [Alphaproteobacteria bacterium]|jgi:hydroxyacylglutathione hydrolase
MTYKISSIKAFSDNYIWALHNHTHALVVDPGDAEPVFAFLEANNLALECILITHHHFDHTGGIAALTNAFPNAKVYGPNNPTIKGINNVLEEADTVDIERFDVFFNILQTPGHTLDHIVYVHRDFMFCGDTLFSGGCGRMFEGTPEVFHSSLQKLAALPANTKVYCTHEYTQANMAFALSVDDKNSDLTEYAKWVDRTRERDEITLPSTIGKECEINPFLRCHSLLIKESIFQNNTSINTVKSDIETFAKLRELKDNF